MSKSFKADTIPLNILNQAFRIVDPDAGPESESITCPHCHQDFQIQRPKIIEEAKLLDLLKILVLSIPRQSCTQQDSINAFDFMQQAREAKDGYFTLTDGIFDWLKKTVERYGPLIFGVNSDAITKALERG